MLATISRWRVCEAACAGDDDDDDDDDDDARALRIFVAMAQRLCKWGYTRVGVHTRVGYTHEWGTHTMDADASSSLRRHHHRIRARADARDGVRDECRVGAAAVSRVDDDAGVARVRRRMAVDAARVSTEVDGDDAGDDDDANAAWRWWRRSRRGFGDGGFDVDVDVDVGGG